MLVFRVFPPTLFERGSPIGQELRHVGQASLPTGPRDPLVPASHLTVSGIAGARLTCDMGSGNLNTCPPAWEVSALLCPESSLQLLFLLIQQRSLDH